jgi:hypothetical protein
MLNIFLFFWAFQISINRIPPTLRQNNSLFTLSPEEKPFCNKSWKSIANPCAPYLNNCELKDQNFNKKNNKLIKNIFN